MTARTRSCRPSLDARARRTGEQGTPQTLYGLADSPIGLAAWMIDHGAVRRSDLPGLVVRRGPEGGLTRDDILDNITHYWLTNRGVSAARLYWGVRAGFARRLAAAALDRGVRSP